MWTDAGSCRNPKTQNKSFRYDELHGIGRLGTLLGSLIIGTLNNGLVLLGVSSPMQLVIKGAIIVAAVAFTKR
jgi:predicted ABC-type sugar transport system permease subunit